MPKVKVPDQLKEIAAEFNLNLADEAEFTNDPEELIGWIRHHLDEQRSEEMQRFDDLEAELDELEAEMMEQPDDRT